MDKTTMIVPCVRKGKAKQLGYSKVLKTEQCTPTNRTGKVKKHHERLTAKYKENRNICDM